MSMIEETIHVAGVSSEIIRVTPLETVAVTVESELIRTESAEIIQVVSELAEIIQAEPVEILQYTDSGPIEILTVTKGIPIPGPIGPGGPPGELALADQEIILEVVEDYEVTHPESYQWSSPGAVAVVDFDHPLPFMPNVQVTDSAGTVLLTVPHLTPGHVHIDLGGALTQVTVYLS